MTNRLMRQWRNKAATVNGWLHLPLTYTAESMARLGFDSITCDMQHGMISYSDLVPMLSGIATTSTVPMVRVSALDPALIGKVLDAGALGIICPMINTAEDARMLVASCRYAPEGSRSYGPNRAIFWGSDYVEKSKEIIMPIAMIETQEAIDNLPEILQTEGLAGIYIGPADLSLSLGQAPSVEPDYPNVTAAISYIAETATKAGVPVGIHTGSALGARKMVSKGFSFVSLPSERIMMERAARVSLSEFNDQAQTNVSAEY